MNRLAPKQEAFPYQAQAIEHIKCREFSAVFHEQGLGKTKIAIDVILYWLASGELDVVIVVAKRGLVPNWLSEFNDHTHIQPSLITNSSRENYYTLNGNSKVIIAHYEAVMKEKERLKLFCTGQKVGIVLDESQKIKNPASNLTSSFFELREYFVRRLILTGTPASNRPYDIWAQVFFLDGGEALGDDFEAFKNDTDINFVADGGTHDDYETNLSNIVEKLSDFAVRETKNSGVIDLPGKKIIRVEADWEKSQYEKYVQTRDELSLIVVQDDIPIEDDSRPILKRMLRLVQLASNPGLVDESYSAEPGKLAVLKDLVSQVVDRGEKVIVWSSFNGNMQYLKHHLSEFGCRMIYGKMGMEERYISLDAFKSRPEVRVLLATPGAAKEGLTLTVANNVIFFDRTFGLADYLQAQDRIHRISQTKNCNVYNIVIPGSIDEWVEDLITAKMMAAQFAQGDIQAAEFRKRMVFNFGESLREVFGLNG